MDNDGQKSKYENMQITSVLQPYPSSGANDTGASGQSCLLCIARKINMSDRGQELVTKLKLNGDIVANDCRLVLI